MKLARLALVAPLAFALVAHAGERLSVEEIKKSLDEKGAHDPFVPEAPLGIDRQALEAGIPKENPLTRAKVALGKQLYFDGRLSKDGTVSCASCHAPDQGWSDKRRFSAGVGGKLGGRHAPTVLNRILSTTQFWDGRAASLEAQALGPIANPVEMAETLPNVVAKLNAIEGYRIQFERVFGGPANEDRIAKAIAAFERTVVAGGSRIDIAEEAERYAKLDDDADAEVKARAKVALENAAKHPLTEAEKRGKQLFFNKAACSLCHTGSNYTDELFHNLGVGVKDGKADDGQAAITKKEEDRGKYKTPGLRNVADRAPYMHDGSEATLEAVVDYYDKGGNKNPHLSPRMKPLGLTKEEKADLVAFLKALSGPLPKIEAPRLP